MRWERNQRRKSYHQRNLYCILQVKLRGENDDEKVWGQTDRPAYRFSHIFSVLSSTTIREEKSIHVCICTVRVLPFRRHIVCACARVYVQKTTKKSEVGKKGRRGGVQEIQNSAIRSFVCSFVRMYILYAHMYVRIPFICHIIASSHRPS